MDFVQYLIDNGYNEEEIGDIFECLYILDEIDGENLNEEVLLEKNLKLAAIEQAIKALKNMPKNAWVTRQLAKLRLARQKATKVAADKADDIAAKAGDGVTSTRPGPEGSATYRPGSTSGGAKRGSTKTPTAKGKGKGSVVKNTGAAALGGGAVAAWKKSSGWLKSLGAAGLGAGVGTILGQTNPPPSSPTQTPDDKTTKPEEPKTPSPEEAAKEAERKRRSQRAYGWWKDIKPRGYASQPGLSAYRNVRQNVNSSHLILGYLLSEGHADTVEEAIYVANQLDEEFIREIINEEI